MKKVLLLCTSHNDLGLIRALRKLGYYIVATGNKDNSPGEKWVDKWIKADYSDKELILNIAKSEKIDAICPCCNDFGVYTAAFIAEKLNLGCYDSYDTTLLLHNKDKFKKFAIEHNIQTPKAERFSNPNSAIIAANKMQFPIIIKPTDCSAGNGVTRVDTVDGIENAVHNAFNKSNAKIIVIEPYLSGTQHGFCTYLLNKKVVAYCSNNEYSIVNPYRVEIDTFPSSNWKICYHELIDQIEKIADILNLKDGIFHLQYIYCNGKIWIIEVMRRVLGNMYSVPANQLTGLDWDYWEARARCGLDCSNFPQNTKQEGYFAYKTIMSNKNGIIKSINIPEGYSPYIYNQFILMNPGDTIEDNMKQPIGFIFMMFKDETDMKRILIDNYSSNLVEIETEMDTI